MLTPLTSMSIAAHQNMKGVNLISSIVTLAFALMCWGQGGGTSTLFSSVCSVSSGISMLHEGYHTILAELGASGKTLGCGDLSGSTFRSNDFH